MMYRTKNKKESLYPFKMYYPFFSNKHIFIVALQVKILIKPKNSSRINEANGGSFK